MSESTPEQEPQPQAAPVPPPVPLTSEDVLVQPGEVLGEHVEHNHPGEPADSPAAPEQPGPAAEDGSNPENAPLGVPEGVSVDPSDSTPEHSP